MLKIVGTLGEPSSEMDAIETDTLEVVSAGQMVAVARLEKS